MRARLVHKALTIAWQEPKLVRVQPMTLLKIIFPVGLLMMSSSAAVCQQTGTAVGRTSGSAAPTGITVTQVISKSTCETMPSVAGCEVAHVPEMWFGRSWDDLV